MILIIGTIIVFILLIINHFEIKFTYHQKVLYFCYKTEENNHIEYGKRETVKCIKLWEN